VQKQESIGESTLIPGFGAQMSVEMSDKVVFADTLYPIANGGVLYLKIDELEQNEFPIAGFLMDSEGKNAIGLLIDPPSPSMAYSKPFSSDGECEAEVIKNGEILAFLDEMQYPSLIGG
jgi:hypothetical protein